MAQIRITFWLSAKVVLAVFSLLGFGEAVSQEESLRRSSVLPNWATEVEIRLAAEADPIEYHRGRFLENRPPPGFRIPAEYEGTHAVVLTWAGYRNLLEDIGRLSYEAGAEVWVIGGPLIFPGVPQSHYRRLGYAYNSVWSRDYGPIGIDNATGALGIVDTRYRHHYSRLDDDAIPCQVAQTASASCFTTQLILDGGNLLTDGKGNVFVTTVIYDWNEGLSREKVDQLLQDYFSADNIHALNYAKTSSGHPADGTGHIDMFVKLLGHCKVLVAQATTEPFLSPLEEAAHFFQHLPCADLDGYQVFRIQAWSAGTTFFTYTNSLIVNQSVLVPSYASGDNQAARQIYEQAMPGYSVLMINSDDPIHSGGSIHCVANEIPLFLPPPNQIPVANAGVNQTVSSQATVSLDGTNSHDPDTDDLTYEWTQQLGPEVLLSSPTAAKPTFVAPTVNLESVKLSFQLVVNDGHFNSKPDMVEVEVKVKPVQQQVCITANNRNHIQKGRAHRCGITRINKACANGSNHYLGRANKWSESSIRESQPGFWEKVDSCL